LQRSTLALHDALPIYDFDLARILDEDGRAWMVKAPRSVIAGAAMEGEVALLENLALAIDDGDLPFEVPRPAGFAPLPEGGRAMRSEEHTSELQSRFDL